jgi:hypothetical protein
MPEAVSAAATAFPELDRQQADQKERVPAARRPTADEGRGRSGR